MQAENASARMLLSGDHAVAYGVKLCRPKLIPVYPITPQTPILEKISLLVDEGICSAEIMTVESEHTAMAAAMTAAMGGVRVFTATASQGLFYMHEMLHFAASARVPVVMVEVNRSHSLPWAFWADHSDSLSQRDTGWVQLYCETPQEALDLVPISFRLAEAVSLPVMPVFEAVYVSHTYEPVSVPPQELVDAFLPPFPDQFRMDTADPHIFGTCVSPKDFMAHRRRWQEAMDRVPAVLTEAFSEWERLTGRPYDLVEAHRTDDADLIIVALGGVAGTVREAVDLLREQGHKVGLVKQRLVRPVPVEQLRRHLAGARKVAVIDRNLSPGLGGIICQEVRAALQGVAGAPPCAQLHRRPRRGQHWRGRRGKDRPAGSDHGRRQSGRGLARRREQVMNHAAPLSGSLRHFDTDEIDLSLQMFNPGHTACPGCGEAQGIKFLLNALGPKTMMIALPSCLTIIAGNGPNSSFNVPVLNMAFGAGAAAASGLSRALRLRGEDDVTVCVLAGDGGTYDIGLQALSGAGERNENILYVCLNNEGYMNTGAQKSSASPLHGVTGSTPAGKRPRGCRLSVSWGSRAASGT